MKRITAIKNCGSALVGLTLSVLASPLIAANEFDPDRAQDPLFLTAPVRPVMMLNMSNDHQLYFKLYDDYTELVEGEGPYTTYTHSYSYYGYFDSQKCYEYGDDDHFEPVEFADEDGYCNDGSSSDQWSGNFLNWSTMTRMDAVRKMLYGGKRSTDEAPSEDEDSLTILERAFLPNDAHSFAKYYNGDDIDQLTPFSVTTGGEGTEDTGITICNTTSHSGSSLSQDVTDPPLMRVAEGNFSLWASNERYQCLWDDETGGGANGENSNDSSVSGIFAHDDSPDDEDDSLGDGDYIVRVEVCKDTLINSDNLEGCESYGTSLKPTGLLQEYGEDETIQFGLMTGSYAANKSGGVLRKNVGGMSDEIDPDDGTFIAPDEDATGVINTLDLFRIYGYRYANGTYHGETGSDNCDWGWSDFDDGQCTNWGNPQSELYLEALRYLAGEDANEDFDVDDSGYISGLDKAGWEEPVDGDNYCAPLNVIQFNASTSSYDGDQLGGASDIMDGTLNSATDEVGDSENIHTNDYFVGSILDADGDAAGDGADQDQLCTAKTVNNLSRVSGTCPDAPRLEGSYQIAGLAHYARSEGISISGLTGVGPRPVTTYGVALAPAVPQIAVETPNEESTITLQPACRNANLNANCSIVDFKIVEQDQVTIDGVTANTGRLYVNWEDSEQGGDYDQDMWGVIDYEVTNSNVSVTTQVVAQSTPDDMGFGYVISGTNDDGFKVHSGINNFTFGTSCETQTVRAPDGDWESHSNCSCRFSGSNGNCDAALAENLDNNARTYSVGSSDASPLEQPLYFAAKWGGYADDEELTDDDIRDADPENYYPATEPQELADSLAKAFARVAASVGAASSVATNSTRLNEGTYLYQARFDSENWSGEIRAFEVGANAFVDSTPEFTTDEGMTGINYSTRDIYTANETSELVRFTWDNLSEDQQGLFDIGDNAGAEERFDWVRGNRDDEGTGGLRERDRILGDVVNSSPVYAGGRSQGYESLGETVGEAYVTFLETQRDKAPLLFVGANDGMMHAFYADDSAGQALSEVFAYIPRGVYEDLPYLAQPNYGGNDNPHRYTVDGALTVRHAYLDEEWATLLIGTLGAGGKGIYALDVTNPSNPEVLFDYTGDVDDDLGYIMGEPKVSRMANGDWRLLFNNGYQSTNGNGYLYALDLEEPDLSDTKIQAGDDSTGLSPISLLPSRDGIATRVYAGDLQGNIWRFDLDNENLGSWALGLGGEPLFTARDDGHEDQVRQPITSAPELGFNSEKGNATMVYVGTGKYLDRSDNTTDYTDSFYAIADTGTALTYGTGTYDRTSILHEKELNDDEDGRSVTGDYETDWAEDDGWFMDFNSSTGERLVETPTLLFDRLVFATIAPSAVPCEFGGTSWLMELVGVGNVFVGEQVLDEFVQTDSMIQGVPLAGSLGADGGVLLWNTTGGGFGGDSVGGGDDEDDDDPVDPPCGDNENCSPLTWPDSATGRQSWQQVR